MSNNGTNPSRSNDRAAAGKAAKTAPVALYRDYWDEEGIRYKKGAVVKVDAARARILIAEGKAERADPLPGEDG